MGDAAGIDFLLPIGRWKGYGGDTDLHGESLETITWATGLLAATERITVFGTVHAPLFHPIIAAKEIVTADHVGRGRFGLNIVAGWNEGEFEMFGVQQREHEARYAYAQEWIEAIKMAWGPNEDFDFDGEHIKLKNVRAKPKPYGGSRPLIMNAGSSGRRARVAELRDASSPRPRPRARASMPPEHGEGRSRARRAVGREIEGVHRRPDRLPPTQKEADDYYRYATIEMDWGSVDRMMAIAADAADARRQGVRREAHVFRFARDRRLSVRRLARPHRH
jgi:alkanesulfonate monooxygenase SsuD/methylene tetrahydromethanopterin reductase-like flavin-dependent oxidoreductase (luciferase family)